MRCSSLQCAKAAWQAVKHAALLLLLLTEVLLAWYPQLHTLLVLQQYSAQEQRQGQQSEWQGENCL